MPSLTTTDKQPHYFLASGKTPAEAKNKTIHFLGTTQLVIYQSTTIHEDEILNSSNPHFWDTIEAAITANRYFCHNLIQELEENGVVHLKKLLDIRQGYPSKLLHILAHMVDGFIGTDSIFYNLEEDSHWISAPLRQRIQQNPGDYWLVPAWHGDLHLSLLHTHKATR